MSGSLIKHNTNFKQIYFDNTVPKSSCDIECDGMASVVIQVCDSDAILLNVTGTTTGEAWDALEVISLGDTAHNWTQISATGLWATGCAGLSRIRLTISALTGALNIYAGLSTGAFAWPYCCTVGRGGQ